MKHQTILSIAANYDFRSSQRSLLQTLAAICFAAEAGRVFGEGLHYHGSIPTAIELGSDFSSDNMRDRLTGLSVKYPELISVLTTHDLNSFDIPNISDLISEIRLSER